MLLCLLAIVPCCFPNLFIRIGVGRTAQAVLNQCVRMGWLKLGLGCDWLSVMLEIAHLRVCMYLLPLCCPFHVPFFLHIPFHRGTNNLSTVALCTPLLPRTGTRPLTCFLMGKAGPFPLYVSSSCASSRQNTREIAQPAWGELAHVEHACGKGPWHTDANPFP